MTRASPTAVRHLRAHDRKPQPWKNGGGTTSEIAAFPAGASLDEFGWRVSIAEVASGGPFSTFPGVDRTLVVLDGEGIDLDVEGRPTSTLGPASAPYRFPADAPTVATLRSGPIRDLNVMTRRGRFDHGVTRLAPDSSRFRLSAPTAMLIARSRPVRLGMPATAFELEAHDALLIEQAHAGAAHVELAITPADGFHSDLIVVAIWPFEGQPPGTARII